MMAGISCHAFELQNYEPWFEWEGGIIYGHSLYMGRTEILSLMTFSLDQP